mmetsp:Transcript_15873/g.49646  ORF Transcript_15873/g.49646 Transcript_15873/m.49646 type:complete len:382 (-) Transcript_15873:1905-3050(-)
MRRFATGAGSLRRTIRQRGKEREKDSAKVTEEGDKESGADEQARDTASGTEDEAALRAAALRIDGVLGVGEDLESWERMRNGEGGGEEGEGEEVTQMESSYLQAAVRNHAEQGNMKALLRLLRRAQQGGLLLPVNDADNWGRTALHWSAHHGHTSVVTLLLAHGADCFAMDHEGWSPLHRAAAAGRSPCVKLLVQQAVRHAAKKWGTDLPTASSLSDVIEYVNAFNFEGSSALSLAVSGGHAHTARLLLLKGARATDIDGKGQTPLHQVAYWRPGGKLATALATMLVEHGADVSHRDSVGKTAHDWAVVKGHADVQRAIIDAVAAKERLASLSASSKRRAKKKGKGKGKPVRRVHFDEAPDATVPSLFEMLEARGITTCDT